MLIIKACNTPTGSGGVWRWIEAAKRDVLKNAVKIAPVNNTLNSQHRGGTDGLYKASFRSNRVGSNGHQLRRTVYNVAPYANIVEKGRSGTNFKATAKDWAVLNSGRLPKRFER